MASGVKYTNNSSLGINVLESNSQVQKFSEGEISRVQHVLKGLDLPSSTFICTSGSAGKLELTGKEPIRLCLICNPSDREETERKVQRVITPFFGNNVVFEWKDGSSQIQVGNICFPSYFIHQIFLKADLNTVDHLFYQFVREVQEMPGEMRQKFKKHFVAKHLKQLRQAMAPYKDLKHSLLLPIQFVLDLRILDAIRVLGHWPKDYVSFLKFMPRAIPDQIKYMHDERLLPELSSQDIADLQSAYQLGLVCQLLGTEGKQVELREAHANAERILRKIDSQKFCEKRDLLT